ISRKLVTVSSFIEKPCLHGPGSSPLPRFVGLGRPSVDNMSPIAVYLRPRPEEVPPPIPSRFALWFRRGLGPRALTVTLSYGFAGRTSGSCRLSVRLSWWRFSGLVNLLWPRGP